MFFDDLNQAVSISTKKRHDFSLILMLNKTRKQNQENRK